MFEKKKTTTKRRHVQTFIYTTTKHKKFKQIINELLENCEYCSAKWNASIYIYLNKNEGIIDLKYTHTHMIYIDREREGGREQRR